MRQGQLQCFIGKRGRFRCPVPEATPEPMGRVLLVGLHVLDDRQKHAGTDVRAGVLAVT